MPVYCRENARETHFENRRGKIRPKFARLHNPLTISLLATHMRLLSAKCKC